MGRAPFWSLSKVHKEKFSIYNYFSKFARQCSYANQSGVTIFYWTSDIGCGSFLHQISLSTISPVICRFMSLPTSSTTKQRSRCRSPRVSGLCFLIQTFAKHNLSLLLSGHWSQPRFTNTSQRNFLSFVIVEIYPAAVIRFPFCFLCLVANGLIFVWWFSFFFSTSCCFNLEYVCCCLFTRKC